jgi:hypothetical protein
MTHVKHFLLAALLLAWPALAQAQAPVRLCIQSATNPNQCAPVTAANPLPVTGTGTVAVGATSITGNATGTTGAVVGTLAAGAAGITTYICGFSVSAIGGTAAVGPITIAGTKTSSMVYQMASTAAGSFLTQTFSPCVPANAAATAITITTTADGTATAVSVNSWGFQL